MTKIFKKSLAVIVALALCLTAIVGGLSVSAEDAPTISAGSDSGNPGDTVTIPITGSGFETGVIYGLDISIDLDGLTFISAESGLIELEYANDLLYTVEGGVFRTLDAIIFEGTGGTLFTLTLEIPAEASGTFTIEVDAIYSEDEAPIDACNVENGTVTVASSHTHEYTLVYSVEDGYCVTKEVCDCGDTVIIASIQNQALTHDPVLQADLTINFRIANTRVAGYTDVHAVFSKEMFEGTAVDGGYAPAVTTINAVTNGTNQEFAYAGVRAKEMSSNIEVNVYGTNANGKVVLLANETYSMVTYIKTAYALYADAVAGTKNAAMRTLLVDLANYGAQAQLYFNYNVDNLANAEIPQTYATPTITSFENVFQQSGVTFGKAPVLENKVLLNIRFTKSGVPSDARLSIDYKNTVGESLNYTVPYAEFASYDSTRFEVMFDKFTAATLSTPFTVNLIDGNDAVLGSFTYSIETYAAQIADSAGNESLKTLTQALVAYGRAANTYFNFG